MWVNSKFLLIMTCNNVLSCLYLGQYLPQIIVYLRQCTGRVSTVLSNPLMVGIRGCILALFSPKTKVYKITVRIQCPGQRGLSVSLLFRKLVANCYSIVLGIYSVGGRACLDRRMMDPDARYWYCRTNTNGWDYSCRPGSTCGYSDGYNFSW